MEAKNEILILFRIVNLFLYPTHKTSQKENHSDHLPTWFSKSQECSTASRKSDYLARTHTSRPISPRATLQANDPDTLPPSSPGRGVLGDINSTSSTIIL